MHDTTNARRDSDHRLSLRGRFFSTMFVLAVCAGLIGSGMFSPFAIGQDANSAEEESNAPPASEADADSTISADALPVPVAIPADAVELPADVFASVPIRSLDMTMEEAPAYYAILNHAAHVPSAKLRESALKFRQLRHRENPKFKSRPFEDFPQFVDLFQNADAYRGRLVTLTGYSRRVRSIVADKNEFGIDTMHEIWLFTDNSQNNPLVVVCTEIPKNLPQGDQLLNGISVTGYFFKLYGYDDSGDDTRLAPMILAHRLQWSPPGSALPEFSPWVLYPGLLVVVSGGIAAIWYLMRRDRLTSPLTRATLEAPDTIGTPPEFSGTPANNEPPPFVTDTPPQGK